MGGMSTPFAQQPYQVRLEWGVAGLARLAPTDVVVVIDVLRFTSVVSERVARGEAVSLEELRSRSLNGAAVVQAAADLPHAPIVIAGCLRNASATAAEIVRIQHERGGRVSVAIVPGGELVSRDEHAALRFAVEDFLGAGAIIDALSSRGIDHTSPEAAAACETFRGLRQALKHLITASGSGRELVERGERHIVDRATMLDVDDVAPRLNDGIFVTVERGAR